MLNIHDSIRNELSPTLVTEYRQQGFVILRSALSQTAQQPVVDLLERLIEAELNKLGLAPSPDPQHEGLLRLRQHAPKRAAWVFETLKNSHTFFHYLYNLDTRVAAQLLGTDADLLSAISPNFRMDEPGDGDRVRKWHLDSSYFQDVASGRHALVMWIPFGKADAEHGSVAVIPGSHTQRDHTVHYQPGGEFASEQWMLDASAIDNSQQVVISADRGDVVLMDFDLVHQTVANHSAKVRYTAIMRLADISSPGYRPVRYRTEYIDY